MDERTKQRILELLADRVSGELSRDEQNELDRLLLTHPEMDNDTIELAAASIDRAFASEEDVLPAALQEKLQEQARKYFAAEGAPERQGAQADRQIAKTPWWSMPALGWAAAAVLLVVAAIGWWQTLTKPTSPHLNAQQARTIEAAPGAVSATLAGTEDPAAEGATGKIVWNADMQKGFMRITGLDANDRKVSQYQLWIFDAGRDDRYPIDGGVFDIPVGSDEVLVAIDARLAVNDPQLFAITVEKPGGVVVSSRERIVLLGDPTKG